MANDVEKGLVWFALTEAGFLERMGRSGLEPEDFDDAKLRRAFSFAHGHHGRHGTLPGVIETAEIAGAEISVVGLDPVFCLDEVLNRKLFRRVKAAVREAEAKLRENRPREAFAGMKDFAESGGVQTSSHPSNLIHMGQEVVDLYQRVKDGYCGVPFAWPSLTDMTRGMWPGTLTMFVARPGVGKTFVAIISARHAWQEGLIPLIVSPEMGKLEMAERFFVIESNVSYVDVVRGTLSDFSFDHLRAKATELREAGVRPVWILDPDDSLTPEAIDAALDATGADLVAIDSMYDLHIKGTKQERLEKALTWSRRSAKKRQKPFLAFSQLNRTSEVALKRGGGSRMGTVALTDQAGWDVYNLFGLEQDKDMRDDRRMRIKKMKLRRGFAENEYVYSHWDFDEMNFAEIEEEERRATFEDSGGWDPERGT